MPPELSCSARPRWWAREAARPHLATRALHRPLTHLWTPPAWACTHQHREASVLRPTHSHGVIRDQRDLSQLPAGWMRHPWDPAASDRSAQCQDRRRKEVVVPLPSTQHIPCGPQAGRGAGNGHCPLGPGRREGHTLQPHPPPWTLGCSGQQAS